jgi:hypothetical protein
LLHLQELETRLGLPRDVSITLEHLILNRNVRDASAWLAGENLPEHVMDELGLGGEVDEDREEVAQRVVTALCRLAGETLPIVFCFDQIESLQRTRTDKEAFFSFGRLAADLSDSAANVFLITCLQASFLEEFKDAVRQADWQRIARRSVLLEGLTSSQVEGLLRSRLDAKPDLAGLRAPHAKDPFYPLETSFVRQLALEFPCVPRRVLALAARQFEVKQLGNEGRGPRPMAEFLSRELEARHQALLPTLKASDTERILARGTPLIADLEGAELVETDPEKADVLLTGVRRVALSFRNETDGRSLTPRLKALLPHTPRKDGAPLVIVRDARLPIPKTAAKARECLDALRARGACVVEPSVEALAALDALASILGDAKSGDLADEEAPAIDAGTVIAWLRSLRGQPVLEPIEEFIATLFGDGSPPPADTLNADLVSLLTQERVLELDNVAKVLGVSTDRALECARKATAHVLVLEGPPAVLLDVSGIVLEGGALS